jgi:hypothetical protein
MEFDECKSILNDPYDTHKCEAWHRIEPGDNELSGTYRYRVTWDDGKTSEDTFKALGTKRVVKQIEE